MWGLPGAAVGLYLAAAWSRRWTTDDAFINFRIVKQIEAGNGPVFNIAERVEASTSAAWLVLLTVVDAVTPLRLEWAALFLQLVLGVIGLVAGMAGAMRLARLLRPPPEDGDGPAVDVTVPLGAMAYMAVAVAWDFATGGLENSLTMAWLGTGFHAVVVLTDQSLTGALTRRRLLATAFLVGSGVLIRPDLAPYCAGLALPVATLAWRRGRTGALAATAAAAAALPLAVQVFRMGYYAQLVPNTLHAKQSTTAWWSQGWTYLINFATPYALVVPVAAALAWLALAWFRPPTDPTPDAVARRRGWRLVVAGIEGAALLHALAVVRVGGDYMHGRLLLPAWFALLLPVLAVPATDLARSRARAGLALAVGAWALATALWARPPAGTLLNPAVVDYATPEELAASTAGEPIGIVDERTVALGDSPVRHPVRWDDYGFAHDPPDGELGDLSDYHPGTFRAGAWTGSYPTPPGIDAMVVPGYVLGVRGYAEDLDVWVYDRLGLADPVVARAELFRRGTAGHETVLPSPWVAAAWVDPGVPVRDPASFAALPRITMIWSGTLVQEEIDAGAFPADRRAAYAALHCGELQELVHDTRAPLSPQRFVGNIVDAVRLHDLTVPVDPHEAEERFCG